VRCYRKAQVKGQFFNFELFVNMHISGLKFFSEDSLSNSDAVFSLWNAPSSHYRVY